MSNLMVEAWSPLLTVQRIYDNALDILTEPLPEYPYNEAAYEAWKKTLLSQQQPLR
jgi:ubiquitin-protein ligase